MGLFLQKRKLHSSLCGLCRLRGIIIPTKTTKATKKTQGLTLREATGFSVRNPGEPMKPKII
jgi:hypothetical protein